MRPVSIWVHRCRSSSTMSFRSSPPKLFEDSRYLIFWPTISTSLHLRLSLRFSGVHSQVWVSSWIPRPAWSFFERGPAPSPISRHQPTSNFEVGWSSLTNVCATLSQPQNFQISLSSDALTLEDFHTLSTFVRVYWLAVMTVKFYVCLSWVPKWSFRSKRCQLRNPLYWKGLCRQRRALLLNLALFRSSRSELDVPCKPRVQLWSPQTLTSQLTPTYSTLI